MKISAVCSFVLSQSTRVTDENRQNYDPQDRSITPASRGKNSIIFLTTAYSVHSVELVVPTFRRKLFNIRFF